MRVSGIQSGNFSGPVGSTRGQQPYRDGVRVREAQDTFWGWTPSGGYIELRARAVVTPRSMVAFWMVGLEDEPERSAEICVTEMFGDAVEPGSAAVGDRPAPVPRPDGRRGLRGGPAAARHRGVPHVRGRLVRRAGHVPGRRRRGAPLRPAADVPDADDARGLRLPRAGPSGTTPTRSPSSSSTACGATSAAVRMVSELVAHTDAKQPPGRDPARYNRRAALSADPEDTDAC